MFKEKESKAHVHCLINNSIARQKKKNKRNTENVAGGLRSLSGTKI